MKPQIYRKVRTDNGVHYTHLEAEAEGIGASHIGKDKVILLGRPKISITKGSYKFGRELQFSVCAHKAAGAAASKRNPSEWNTIEICIPLEVGRRLIEETYKELVEYEY